MAKKQNKKKSLKTYLKFELYGIVILILSVIALANGGAVGRSLNYLFRFLIGSWDFVFPVLGVVFGIGVMVTRGWPLIWTVRLSGIYLFFLSILVMAHMRLFGELTASGKFTDQSIVTLTWDLLKKATFSAEKTDVGGGMIGGLTFGLLHYLFGPMGTQMVVYMMVLVSIVLVTGISYINILTKVKQKLSLIGQQFKNRIKELVILLYDSNQAAKSKPKPKLSGNIKEKDGAEGAGEPRKKVKFFQWAKTESASTQEESPVVIRDFADQLIAEQTSISPEPAKIFDFQDRMESAALQQEAHLRMSGKNSTLSDEMELTMTAMTFAEEPAPFTLPPFSLLDKPKGSGKGDDRSEFTANAKKLESTLESFGVRARVTQIHRGPAVTRYEVQPDVGVKVSKIVSLTDDLALALAAKDIRIEAPIPGKAAVGIEVPNQEVAVVTLREVLESSAYHEASSKLSIAFGRDISGEPIVGNLAKMPHLLVAGATGSGKSVCINGIITSILYKAKPNEVKFLMVDPKMVELNVYNGIPHLLAPVVTDPRRASMALKKVVAEMEKRYELFAQSGTRDIERYNALMASRENAGPGPALPYIVVIVDELADLMMVAPADVEDAICRLAQMARAAGIHLIIATQRPSVDVITGVIKANIPSRIAFGVSSMTDSRTILDMGGAEKLLGRGDMLFLPMGASKPTRVQGAFVSDHEVEAIVNFTRDQQKVKYQEELVPELEEATTGQPDHEDELYDQAVQMVVEAKQASVSLLQRRLRVGYTRAARLIDAMEAKGVVGPYEGSKPRDVLISYEQWSQSKLSS